MWKAMIPSVQGTDLGTKIRPDCIRCYDVAALLALLRSHWRDENLSVTMNYQRRWGNFTREKGESLFSFVTKMIMFREEANAQGCEIPEDQILLKTLFEAEDQPVLRHKAAKFHQRFKDWKKAGKPAGSSTKPTLDTRF